MPLHRLRAVLGLVALAAALALPLAGCGGDQKGTYQDEYRKAAAEFKQSAELSAQNVPKRLRDRTPALQSFKQSLDKLATRLAELDPPSQAAKLNDRAVARLHAYSRDIGRYARAARRSDRRAAAQLAPKLRRDQASLQTVLDAIDKTLSK
jgi:hypothetical protein